MQEATKQERPAISKEENAALKSKTSAECRGYRGILDSTAKFFGVRTSFSEETGEVSCTYYPCTEGTEDGGFQLTGYKERQHPKKFVSVGRTGSTCQLFGQFRFKTENKTCLLVEGEHDTLAAWQMLKKYYESKGWDFKPVVVSPTTGKNCLQQIRNNYSFFQQFDKIVVGFDADEAGSEAAQEVTTALPRGKVWIAKWSSKDPNAMLMEGKEKDFIRDFYNAKPWLPTGVVGSSSLYALQLQQTDSPVVQFPPFMKKAGDLVGHLQMKYIYNIAAETSIGKTTVVNECIYHWVMNSPVKVGIFTLELDCAQYGNVLLSRHMHVNVNRMSPSDRKEFLQRAEVKAASDTLYFKEDGSDRFLLIDDREGSVEGAQRAMEEMIISSGVKLIVIDPLQDLLAGATLEDQDLFLKWLKQMIKMYEVSFVLINHMRKRPQGTKEDHKPSEFDIIGSSSIIKSAAVNIILRRNKMAECEIERNTTYVDVPKSRITGDTGDGGAFFYDSKTHTLHDKAMIGVDYT